MKMSLTTSRSEFNDNLKSSRMVSVCREIFTDADTPVSIYRRLSSAAPAAFLLESAAQGGVFARYSFIGAGSFGVLTEHEGKAEWQQAPGSSLTEARLIDGGVKNLNPVEALEALHQLWKSEQQGLPPFSNGFVGYLGWETVNELFDTSNIANLRSALPRQMMSLVSELVVVDHQEGDVVLIANVLNDGCHEADQLWNEANQRLDSLQAKLAEPSTAKLATKIDVEPKVTRSFPKEKFLAGVNEIKNRIEAGEASQVVLSQRFSEKLDADPLDVYRVLRHNNPSPFLYLLNFTGVANQSFSVVGSSPEALITVKSGKVITHPIAGSRPRGANVHEDLRLEEELLEDAKEVSEHKMLVDLAKDDLSLICDEDTLEISGYMRVEKFSHIMHIVSTVSGQLKETENAVSAFKATFPAGTLSGSPKPLSIEMIAELEREPRGVYGGVVGYFSGNGDADLAIAIRTATLHDNIAYVQAGAGVVAESIPETEDQETVNKAMAPLRAIAIANSLKPLTLEK